MLPHVDVNLLPVGVRLCSSFEAIISHKLLIDALCGSWFFRRVSDSAASRWRPFVMWRWCNAAAEWDTSYSWLLLLWTNNMQYSYLASFKLPASRLKHDEPKKPLFVKHAHTASTRLIAFQLFLLRLGGFNTYLPAFKYNFLGMHFNYTFWWSSVGLATAHWSKCYLCHTAGGVQLRNKPRDASQEVGCNGAFPGDRWILVSATK